jgi:hypothetical protein
MKTVKDLLEAINNREDYEICDSYNGEFYYEGTLDFNTSFNNAKIKTYGRDVISLVEKENIPLETRVCIWDYDDFHSWDLTGDGFEIDDENRRIILICKPFEVVGSE